MPGIARLTTDSALCPSPRVSVMSTSSMPALWTLLNPTTTAPRTSDSAVSTMRLPWRSTSPPIPKQNSDPTSDATKLISAKRTRSTARSRSSGSVMRPRPCVRPGSVPTMASAATPTTTQP